MHVLNILHHMRLWGDVTWVEIKNDLIFIQWFNVAVTSHFPSSQNWSILFSMT